MAAEVLLNPVITVNAVDLSNRIDQVTIEEDVAEVESSAFGSSNRTYLAGLQGNKVTLEFQGDYADAEVDQTIQPLVGTLTTITVKKAAGTTTSANPAWSFTALISKWKPIDGKVGDLIKISATWPISGAVTKTTS